MNIEQAVKAALDMPHIITRHSGKDLGPRVRVTLVEQTGDTAKLKVKDRADDRAAAPPREVLLTVTPSRVFCSGGVAAQPEMSQVLTHLRSKVPGAGNVITDAAESELRTMGFALPVDATTPEAPQTPAAPPVPVIPERATRRGETKATAVEGNQ